MLILHGIVAVAAVAAIAMAPRGGVSVAVIAGAATLDVLLGADIGPAVAVVAPLLAFLGAALSLAAMIERSGLCDRGADLLAAAAQGHAWRLFALVCALCAALTSVVSLDGAVVLVVPVVLALRRRFGAPLAPLFLGVVAVANVSSVAVPQGNPTNLVVMDRLHVSAQAFLGHMLLPGAAATAACAALIGFGERRSLRVALPMPRSERAPLSAGEKHAAAAIVAGALVGSGAPLVGIAPWWPFAATVAIALATSPHRARLVVPWRIAVQAMGLVVVASALGVHLPVPMDPGVAVGIAVALAVATSAAVANNLPATVWATTLLGTGPLAYPATIGLAMGGLATRQGSVATLIAVDLAQVEDPPLRITRLLSLALVGLVVACVALLML